MADAKRAEDDMDKLPTLTRVIVRVMFREGPVVLAFLVMLAVILGIIPSPYLGQPLNTIIQTQKEIVQAHHEQLTVLEQIHDELKKWHQDDERRKP